jgi:hypothetical protein
MPLFDNQTNTDTNQTENYETKSEPTKPNSLITTLGQVLPFAPLLFEQFTGQKLPQMGGTIAEIQLVLNTIQNGLQTVVNNQQELAQRLVNLETNANSQLTNLTQQFQSLRLTHTRERKEIDFNNPKQLETEY